ncbi:serine hydrolase [Georgenia subflava]|uniref:Serine hydrolase n=1 Tax=Georgenia subflava TaxID=1622177 RepID=A0A6N7EBR2_9MICO|nr:serine hydrolase [Georgenia subflava]
MRSGTTEALSRRLADEQAGSRLPSVCAALVRDGASVWCDARGTADGRADGTTVGPGTQYRIGSITKTLVATAVMRLRDEGRLDLLDPLERHLPGTALGGATIGQLLSHSAGLQAEPDGPWWERTPGAGWEELTGSLTVASTRHRPGRRHHYSNVGYAVLGELLARLRGAPWDQVLRTELLEPLGMTRTSTGPVAPYAPGLAVHPFADVVLPEPAHDAGAMAPAGQLWSTAGDLSRWAAFLAGDTGDLLAPDTLAEMSEPLVLNDVPGEAWTGAYGLGLQVWNLEGRRLVGHGGSVPGFVAALRVDVASGDGVVVLTNSTTGISATVAEDLLRLLEECEPRTPPAWQVRPVGAGSLELAGQWFWGPAPLVLRALPDGGLSLVPTGPTGRGSRFVPSGSDTWTGLDGYYAGETLRAVRGPDGAVRHLDVASFHLTRSPYDPGTDVPGGVDPAGWR